MLADILVGLKQHKLSYLFVEREGELVGEGFTNKSGHNYYSVGLALVGRVQGMGIGTQLMWVLEEASRRLGAKRLHLTVWSANHAGIHVYQKVGYQQCGRRVGWILMDDGSECDVIDMTKVIATN
jgi:ribosomal protein S18 acetylase RimI-like enzyme